jgi:hypothetical protein
MPEARGEVRLALKPMVANRPSVQVGELDRAALSSLGVRDRMDDARATSPECLSQHPAPHPIGR